jgi:pyruvate carboxylase
VVEVEAAQEVLVGLAVARVLRDDEAGHELEHLARALRRAAAQQLALDDPLRRRIGRAHRVVVVAGHGDGLALRDAHQSLMATRMAMEDMVDACADIDQPATGRVECWGGATFDACIRFLNEDPWERLRTFRELMPNSRLQMLLRGQNLLGYRHYEDSVVDRFVEKSAENGMDVFRVFDALNDPRNMAHAMAAVRRRPASTPRAPSATR